MELGKFLTDHGSRTVVGSIVDHEYLDLQLIGVMNDGYRDIL